MPSADKKAAAAELAAVLEADLLRQHGSSLLTGESLRQALGYRSVHALRKAIERGTVPVSIFPIENRRGQYALTKDVANWLAKQRIGGRPKRKPISRLPA